VSLEWSLWKYCPGH